MKEQLSSHRKLSDFMNSLSSHDQRLHAFRSYHLLCFLTEKSVFQFVACFPVLWVNQHLALGFISPHLPLFLNHSCIACIWKKSVLNLFNSATHNFVCIKKIYKHFTFSNSGVSLGNNSQVEKMSFSFFSAFKLVLGSLLPRETR